MNRFCMTKSKVIFTLLGFFRPYGIVKRFRFKKPPGSECEEALFFKKFTILSRFPIGGNYFWPIRRIGSIYLLLFSILIYATLSHNFLSVALNSNKIITIKVYGYFFFHFYISVAKPFLNLLQKISQKKYSLKINCAMN